LRGESFYRKIEKTLSLFVKLIVSPNIHREKSQFFIKLIDINLYKRLTRDLTPTPKAGSPALILPGSFICGSNETLLTRCPAASNGASNLLESELEGQNQVNQLAQAALLDPG
jgi:hypothetical protein